MRPFFIFNFSFLICLALPCAAQRTYTLAELLDMARANNRALQSAALAVEAAGEQKKEAYANYFPQISANVMAFQAFDKMVKSDGTYPQELAALGEINPAFAQLAGQPYSVAEMNRAYAITATAMQPIYAGGKIHTGNQLADVQATVAALQRQLKEKDVLQKVTENFWNTAATKYRLRTIEAAERQMEAVYKQVDATVRAGVTTRNALLKVRLRQQELASNRLRTENGIRLQLLLLAQQTGADGKDFDIALPDDSLCPDLPAEADAQLAADAREELRLAEQNVEAQRLQIKMQRADMLPTVAVALMGYHTGLGGFSDNMKPYVPGTMTNGLVALTVSVPISAWWGTGRHAVRRQRIALQQAQCDRDDAREQLAIDIQSAYLSLTEARKQIDIARASVEEADENWRMSQQQYKAGTETITDLLDAETLQREAADNLSAYIAAYHIRLADYRRKCQ